MTITYLDDNLTGMKTISTALFLTLLASACASISKSDESPSALKGAKIVSFQANFNQFWNAVRNQKFERQIDLWNLIVEKPNQDYFDSMVWFQKDSSDFNERRLARLKKIFGFYAENAEKIKTAFDRFNGVLKEEVRRFAKVFPDSKFPVTVYASLSPTFIGRTGTLKTSHLQILAFGIDKIVEANINPNVLYSHELFHIYHGLKSGIQDTDEEREKDSLVIPLWVEGLATFVSHELYPEATNTEIFINADLRDFPESRLPELAAAFLKILDESNINAKSPEIYIHWFGNDKKFGKDFPGCAGYLLGYKVVEALRGKSTLDEMATWDAHKVNKEVRSVLLAISQNGARN